MSDARSAEVEAEATDRFRLAEYRCAECEEFGYCDRHPHAAEGMDPGPLPAQPAAEPGDVEVLARVESLAALIDGLRAERDAYRMSRWLREWAAAHSEGGVQLAFRQIGDYDPPNRIWELSIWLDWTKVGFGIDTERQYRSPSWPDVLWVCATFGPLTFAAVRTWNESKPTRPIPPGQSDGADQ